MTSAEQDKIVIPFIGAFSSGKSSLLNSLLDMDLLTTAITPETARATELSYGETATFTAHFFDGATQKLTQEAFQSLSSSTAENVPDWFEVKNPNLTAWPDLTLVDLPGWSSGDSAHEQLLDKYLRHLGKTHLITNTRFVVVVSVDEGTLQESLLEHLKTLDLNDAGYWLVLNKTDKRSEDDLAAVKQHIKQQITQALGAPPLATLLTSARKKDKVVLAKCFDDLQASLTKAPALDKEELKASVKHHLEQIESFRQNISDTAEDAADDIWHEIWMRTAEQCFEYVDYKNPHREGRDFQDDVERLYEKIITEKFDNKKPVANGELVASLQGLGISMPTADLLDKKTGLLLKQIKLLIGTALEKAKPGFLGSKEPEEVGRRIYLKVYDMEDRYRANFKGHARLAYREWYDRYSEDWNRILNLI